MLYIAGMALSAASVCAKEYHVATSGSDTNSGTITSPLKTINAAAIKAYPGDTITVHEGIYRERVVPPRGGDSDKSRILYRAAEGESVTITGSEPIGNWVKVKDNTWKTTLPNTFFGESNPFDEQIYGSWYRGKGRPNHTGSVYLNGQRIRETFSLGDVMQPVKDSPRWYAEADGNGGPVLMNFEWICPSGGEKMTSMHATVEGGDQAVCIAVIDRWPFGYLKDKSVMHFSGVDFGAGTDTLMFQAATLAKGGIVEMYLDGDKKELLGSAMVTNTGDWEKFEVFPLKMNRSLSGRHDIRFELKAPARYLDGKTIIWAQFPDGTDPNKENVEISVRPQVFYPDRTGINYITVRGFTLENAATNWAPPSAEQPGLIGPRWAKGWIIEDNVIRNSRCSGISLGRPTFGHAHHYQELPPQVYPEAGGGQTREQLLDYFENASWDKNEAGFHIVRNNHIYECGQAGIVGCSGGAFSVIEGNEIHDICMGETFEGDEMAGIKLHFANDAVIKDNHIYRTIRGLWLDWGSQGMQITGNLLHDNNHCEDLFVEVCHGPVFVANNIMLSRNGSSMSQGIAYVHNLITGNISGGQDRCAGGRLTYFYEPHGTTSLGKVPNPGGDLQWYNNILTKDASLRNWDEPGLPIRYSGNIFSDGARPNDADKRASVYGDTGLDVKLTEKEDGWYLVMNVPLAWDNRSKTKKVTTKMLGKAITPNQPFTNPDGSPLSCDKDYFGSSRNSSNPYPGPVEINRPGLHEWKVWPKK